ncbi:RecQ family ATP-dependent DNA helicase [Halalkalibacterium ligniniphilum]|uniref:RecQ family ATP-dependent DNA helicase n=1 Tax=Halalkalibacterium ligniniphilum TaxID=1134413 RepID=UPI00034A2DD2|nr:ATP-dependent DNA helicase RecQ [Halalkalibacterium ligniniphilum]
MMLEQALKKWFGFTDFREGQKEVIEALLKQQDVFSMLPTGTGKSICYQLPALLAEGITIVVSPLLSLMEDQVQQLKSKGIKQVAALNSFLTEQKRKEVMASIHHFKLMYVSPEMLQQPSVLTLLRSQKVSYFVIDEAHCISQWGQEFRPDYLRLADVRKQLGTPPCLAITATATKDVQDDIKRRLRLHEATNIVYSVDRPNIAMMVERYHSTKEKLQALITFVKNLKGPGIIYFSSRQWTEKISYALREAGIDKVSHYHGGMSNEDRILIQQQFMEGQLSVICCTSAFGMGIHKPDVRFVIHFHYPTQLASYVQEIGRAGRDGRKSIAILLYSQEDKGIPRSLLDLELPSEQEIDAYIQAVMNVSRLTKEQEEQIRIISGGSETSWRQLKYLLEERGIMKGTEVRRFSADAIKAELRNHVSQRRAEKQQQLTEFERWIHSYSCRREKLLAHFSEALQSRPPHCCDNCGVTYQSYQKRKEEGEEKKSDWKTILAQLFHQSEGGAS